MEPVTCKYYLLRHNNSNASEVVVYQSNDREEVQKVKGELESQLPMDVYEKFSYRLLENENFE